MLEKQTKQNITPLFKILLVLASFLGALIALGAAAVLLIGVNHTSIFLIARAWTPIFLLIVPAATLAFSAGVVLRSQPVHSLLCLIAVFFSTVMLYLYAGAEFLSFTFLIVYVGAIAILFIFVIMLLNLKLPAAVFTAAVAGSSYFAFLSAAVTSVEVDDTLSTGLMNLVVETGLPAFKTENTSVDALQYFVTNKFVDILAFSDTLYTYHSYLFYQTAILLLTAMVGAIVLATSATDREEHKEMVLSRYPEAR